VPKKLHIVICFSVLSPVGMAIALIDRFVSAGLDLSSSVVFRRSPSFLLFLARGCYPRVAVASFVV
jgi:hypothetical protein